MPAGADAGFANTFLDISPTVACLEGISPTTTAERQTPRVPPNHEEEGRFARVPENMG